MHFPWNDRKVVHRILTTIPFRTVGLDPVETPVGSFRSIAPVDSLHPWRSATWEKRVTLDRSNR